MTRQIPASELPMQGNGAIYHLNLRPEELADNVILVGDPVVCQSSLACSTQWRCANRTVS